MTVYLKDIAYEEGKKAYTDGVAEIDCPYHVREGRFNASADKVLRDCGYIEARKDSGDAAQCAS